jgi:hypothetical protein
VPRAAAGLTRGLPQAGPAKRGLSFFDEGKSIKFLAH